MPRFGSKKRTRPSGPTVDFPRGQPIGRTAKSLAVWWNRALSLRDVVRRRVSGSFASCPLWDSDATRAERASSAIGRARQQTVRTIGAARRVVRQLRAFAWAADRRLRADVAVSRALLAATDRWSDRAAHGAPEADRPRRVS